MSTRLGFDETFRRMWSFYLAYSEAGFRSGYLDVVQLVLAQRLMLAGSKGDVILVDIPPEPERDCPRCFGSSEILGDSGALDDNGGRNG